ncbi:DUF664 domain-containing protein [Streptomyces sp. NPDC047525]|uniref:mycothiol transferase n=1 Tax=Streptomyces sp. NPDC047525 TaxID=3155264 RepID=UPI0033D89AB6
MTRVDDTPPAWDESKALLPGSPLMAMSGVINHLRWVEYYWFQVVFLGEEDRGPWTEEDPDREMRIAVDFPLTQLLDDARRHDRQLEPAAITGGARVQRTDEQGPPRSPHHTGVSGAPAASRARSRR